MNSPVLLLIFNRPETTARVFQRIREARPPRLYLASDGPRAEKVGESETVLGLREELLSAIDWPCELQTLFRDDNLGCARAVSGAITWFFEHEEEGIILEDDTLPDPTFFRFCDELLARYRTDERIGMISGDNFQRGRLRGEASYYFSKFNHIWGWASWRRVWRNYDLALNEWPALRETSFVKDLSDGDAAFVRNWTRVFDQVHQGLIDTWDYSFVYSVWKCGYLTILPQVNLVSNIGFGALGTHTTNVDDPNAALPVYSMEFPLTHPQVVNRHSEADLFTQRVAFRPGMVARIKWRLKALISKVARK